MLAWVMENRGNIVICTVLVLLVVGVIRSMIRSKKKGKTSCGCGCSNCAMSGLCHAGGREDEE